MNTKPFALMAMGAVLGITIATMVHRTHNPPTAPGMRNEVVRQPAPSLPPAALPPQIATIPQAAPSPQASIPRAALPPATGANADAPTRLTEAFARKRDVQKLLAAGFTQERIDWIMQRKEELLADRRRVVEQEKKDALPPDPYAARYILDPDLDLRKEMSVQEYEQLRLAMGRDMSAGITGVLPGGSAATAGLQAGDEILSYDGKRVFNFFDLQKQAAESKAGGYVLVDFKRDGQALQVRVPAGPLGLRDQSMFTILNRRSSAATRPSTPVSPNLGIQPDGPASQAQQRQ
jgi:hypothetical protein